MKTTKLCAFTLTLLCAGGMTVANAEISTGSSATASQAVKAGRTYTDMTRNQQLKKISGDGVEAKNVADAESSSNVSTGAGMDPVAAQQAAQVLGFTSEDAANIVAAKQVEENSTVSTGAGLAHPAGLALGVEAVNHSIAKEDDGLYVNKSNAQQASSVVKSSSLSAGINGSLQNKKQSADDDVNAAVNTAEEESSSSDSQSQSQVDVEYADDATSAVMDTVGGEPPSGQSMEKEYVGGAETDYNEATSWM